MSRYFSIARLVPLGIAVNLCLSGQRCLTQPPAATAIKADRDTVTAFSLNREEATEKIILDSTGHWLAIAGGDGTVSVWDLKLREPRATTIAAVPPKQRPWEIAFTPNGRWLVVGSDDVSIRLWSMSAAAPAATSVTLKTGVILVKKLTFSPDANWLTVRDTQGRVWLWDLRVNDPSRRRFEIGWPNYVESITFTPNSRWLVTTSPRRHREEEAGFYLCAARLWELQADDPSLNSIAVFGPDSTIGDVSVSPDDRWLVIRTPGKQLQLWDFERYRTLPESEGRAVAAVGKLQGKVETAEGKVIALSLRTKNADSGLEQAKCFPHLQRIQTHAYSIITDAGLAHLTDLQQLQELIVPQSGEITDAGLRSLSNLSKLERLNVSGAKVSGVGLRNLRALPNLLSLIIKHNALSDKGLDELGALTQLTSLEMRNTGLTDAGLEKLKHLTNLEYLGLWGNPISNGGLAHVEAFAKLRSLDISGVSVSEDRLKRLRSALPALQEVNRWGTAGPPGPIWEKVANPSDRSEPIVRLRGKVNVIDAHTLEFEDGTIAELNGAMMAPDLEQMGSIGGAAYPCGKEAAEFLRKLIGDQEVICYHPGKRKDGKLDGRHCFLGEKRLVEEIVRNGWAISDHTEMEGWEAMAKAIRCGLWRGKFALAPKR